MAPSPAVPPTSDGARRWPRRLVGGLLGLLGLALVAALAAAALLRHPLPPAEAGPAAEALADRMQAAVDTAAWARTGAVRWVFAGRTAHLWDRQRHLDLIETGDERVMIDLDSRQGRAWRGAVELTGAEREAALAGAWAAWCNDSYWLNPVAKLRDPGTRRALARVDGADALLLSHDSGGTTPGDRYLWRVDAAGRPTAWRMWVQVLPVPGLEASWEGWIRLDTGAWVATRHAIGPVTLALTEVAGAESLAALVGPVDPFAPLVGGERP